MGRKIVDATELAPGDRIVTNRHGAVETITAPSERGSHGTVTIHTDRSDITTTLPCPVEAR